MHGIIFGMQQYFTNEELELNQLLKLDENTVHHITNVLRKKDGYIFRMVDKSNKCYLCKLEDFMARVISVVEEDHELDIDVTIVLSLIKNDQFELALQKLTELGVKRIVPYVANRSVIKIKDEKHKLERFRKIVKEASEQSHRDIIPEITSPATIRDLEKYLSKYNYVAYEKHNGSMLPFSEIDNSVTIIIGPEGGFELSEVESFEKMGFECCSLGKRILRAETAAMFVMANITGVFDK